MRLFLAIELPQDVRDHIVRLQNAIRSIVRDLSFTRPDNLHITLKFLGEVADSAVKPLCDSLAAIPPSGPVQLQAAELTCFPERGPIRIVGAGLTAPPALTTLVTRIETACQSHGFPPEGRPYSAHITLARARNPLPPYLRNNMQAAAARLWPGPTMTATEYVLMQSDLTPKGPIYTPAAHFAL